MRQPEVEVLLATYNGEQFIREQIESIFYTPDSLAVRLTPPDNEFEDLEEYHRRPRYRFTVTMD